jgi:hypothetical protein
VGKRAISVLVAGIFVLGACSGASKNAAPTSTPPSESTTVPRRTTTVPRSTTTTSTPEYSFDDSVPPPKLINTGTNYVAILKSLESYANWLAAHHPDPTLTSRIVAQGTKMYRGYAQDYTRLRDNNSRLVEELGGATRYAIVSTTPDAFSARVIEDIRVHMSVNTSGRVTGENRFTTLTTYVDVVVMVGGLWHFASIDILTPPHVKL